jgi:hypothetical protein
MCQWWKKPIPKNVQKMSMKKKKHIRVNILCKKSLSKHDVCDLFFKSYEI